MSRLWTHLRYPSCADNAAFGIDRRSARAVIFRTRRERFDLDLATVGVSHELPALADERPAIVDPVDLEAAEPVARAIDEMYRPRT